MKKYIALFTALFLFFVLAGCEDIGSTKTDPSTGPASGWQETDGQRFYYIDGVMQTGWVTIDNQLYCFGNDGAMVTGWAEKDGVRCYLRSDGTLATGWLNDGSRRYYLNESGTPVTGWQEIGGKRFFFQEGGDLLSGWAQLDGKTYYFGVDGSMVTGLMNVEGKGYYFNEDGAMHTGWLTLEDKRYHFDADGIMAVGPREIDGAMYYFSPHGVHILLVNPWNYLPEGYEPDLKPVESIYQIDASCLEALEQMMADCRAAGYAPMIVSGYRTQGDQTFLYNRKVNYYLDLGLARADAEREAAKTIAIPGTSEHQLGLAADIVGSDYPYLDDNQANTGTQKWLMEHCHEYGFILRYPAGTTDITGIIYEPWHYRYVGVEIAEEITNLGITLEEYLDAVVTE